MSDVQDEVTQLDAVPQCAIGAPLPVVLGNELSLVLAYLVENRPSDWDGSSVRVVDMDSPRAVARVKFAKPHAFTLGPPNDEAFSGHLLANRGLHPYGAFEIQDSSWIDQLREMNSVHPQHRDEVFDGYRHFIFTFHDSTFECVAEALSAEVVGGPLSQVVAQLPQELE